MSANSLRPVNLQTDLLPLADLIELVFAPTMDEGGRAAIREMRYMSRMGVGLSLMSRMNEIMSGIKMGYVWVEDGKLVGNVSVYPAPMPDGSRNTWIIANVGVHPAYQGRGIARQLMIASMEMLARRGNQRAVLQVDYDNDKAIHLYERLGFFRERAFTQWKRNSLTPLPTLPETPPFMTWRRRSEWQAEWALAEQTRPQSGGGIGWLRPMDTRLFVRPWWREMLHWLTMQNIERLIVRDEATHTLRASVWVENNLGAFTTRLTLLIRPDSASLTPHLLSNVIRRYRTTTIELEHPADDDPVNQWLSVLRFRSERTVYHMHWNSP